MGSVHRKRAAGRAPDLSRPHAEYGGVHDPGVHSSDEARACSQRIFSEEVRGGRATAICRFAESPAGAGLPALRRGEFAAESRRPVAGRPAASRVFPTSTPERSLLVNAESHRLLEI